MDPMTYNVRANNTAMVGREACPVYMEENRW
jgi:hypothetical protein